MRIRYLENMRAVRPASARRPDFERLSALARYSFISHTNTARAEAPAATRTVCSSVWPK
jgi:hypothetical protein